MSSTEEQKSLEQTPTWAVATVCTVFVVASLLLERGIHALGRVSDMDTRDFHACSRYSDHGHNPITTATT